MKLLNAANMWAITLLCNKVGMKCVLFNLLVGGMVMRGWIWGGGRGHGQLESYPCFYVYSVRHHSEDIQICLSVPSLQHSAIKLDGQMDCSLRNEKWI